MIRAESETYARREDVHAGGLSGDTYRFFLSGPFWARVHHVRFTAGTEVTHRASLLLLMGAGFHRRCHLPRLNIPLLSPPGESARV